MYRLFLQLVLIASFIAHLTNGFASHSAKAATLQELLSGATLQTQDLIWENWRGYSGPADPSRIVVELITSNALEPRLVFSGPDTTLNPPLSSPAGGSQATQFLYDVRTLIGANRINGSSLHMTGAGVRPGGQIEVNADSGFSTLQVSMTAVAEGNTIFVGDATATFASQKVLTITNEINLTGGPQNFPGKSFATILASFEQGYSVLPLPPCPVTELTTTPPHPLQLAYNLNNLVMDMQTAVQAFQQKVLNEPGTQSFEPTSGLRSTDYQRHLYELRTKYLDLDGVNGIVAYVDPNLGQNGRPQLRINPGTVGQQCESLVNQVNQEIRDHLLKPGLLGAPAVNPPGTSLHESGRAVDISITGVTTTRRRELASMAGLYERYPSTDPGHYELTGASPSIQGVIVGNSPINLLVQDPLGRRLGFDPMSGQAVNDFGEYAEYSGPGSEPQVLVIPLGSVTFGDYQITGLGTGDGPYSVRAIVFDGSESGEPLREWLVGTGIASPGIAIGALQTQLAIPEPSALILSTIAFVALFAAYRASRNFGISRKSTSCPDITRRAILDSVVNSRTQPWTFRKPEGTQRLITRPL